MVSRISFDNNLIKAMEVFVAIAETGQVTIAAKLLGITQSAASQHLRTLETTFGVTLLDRTVRPVKLTQAGELFHRHTLRVLNEVEDLVTDMRHQGARPISRLRVGMLASTATTLTPDLIALAKDEFKVDDMTVYAGQETDHAGLLRAKQVDLAITSNPLYDMDGLERYSILKESFLLVLPKSYDGPTSNLEEIFKRLPLVRFASTTSIGRRTEQHLRRLKLQAPRVIQADRSSMVTACVARGMGCTLLTPSLLIDGFVERMPLNIRPLPIAGISRTITLLARSKELGALPYRFAETSKRILTTQIEQQMGQTGLNAVEISPDE